MKRILSKTLCLFLLMVLAIPTPSVSADGAADFETGTPGTFFIIPWEQTNITQQDNFFPLYFCRNNNKKATKASEVDVVAWATEVKNYTDKMPEGKRGIFISNNILNLLKSDTDSPYPWFGGMDKLKELMDTFFTYYKRIGGKDIDFVVTDPEYGGGPWKIDGEGRNTYGFKTTKDVFDDLVKNPRYISEVRPELVRLGFEFCTEPGENELKYGYEEMYMHEVSKDIDDMRGTRLDNFYKLQAAFGNYQPTALYESVYEVVKKHYPDALYGDYSNYVTAETEVPSPQGHLWKYRRDAKAGNFSSKSAYGYNFLYGSNFKGYFPDYPLDKVQLTVYNSFFIQQQQLRHGAIYTQNNMFMPFVGTYQYKGHDIAPAMCDYWSEYRFHEFLSSSIPALLLYNGTNSSMSNPDCDAKLSSIAKEMDELLGFPDRKPLMEELMPWDSKYYLSGMSANGKNVWRITPDLCYTDFTIEDFLYDEENLIFKIFNQFVDFPEGSFIYKTKENNSTFGYWVISPEGTRPLEYRDESLPGIKPNDMEATALNKVLLQKKAIEARMRQGESEQEAMDRVVFPWMKRGGKQALAYTIEDVWGKDVAPDGAGASASIVGTDDSKKVLKSYRDDENERETIDHTSNIGLENDLE